MFSEDQLEQLRSFPDIGKDDLIRCAKPLEKGTRNWSCSPRCARSSSAARGGGLGQALWAPCPGHHCGALNWVRNGAWADVLAGAAAGRLSAWRPAVRR